MINFVETLKRPFANVLALILGIGIGALPVVNILLLGFGAGEAERVLHKQKKPMKWWHMHAILRDSISAFAVTLFYLSPFILASFIFLGQFIADAINISNETKLLDLALFGAAPFEFAVIIFNSGGQLLELATQNIFFIAPIALLGSILYYVLPFALINFWREDKFIAAFDLGKVGKAFTSKYLFYWLLFHFYIAVLFYALGLLFFLPVINFLLAGFILFVYFSSGFNLAAQLFAEK